MSAKPQRGDKPVHVMKTPDLSDLPEHSAPQEAQDTKPTLLELANVHRDAEALELRRRYHSYPQIKERLGFATLDEAKAAVGRAGERLWVLHEDDQEQIQLELARYDEMARAVLDVMAQRHYIISNSGKIVEDPVTGQPLLDPMPTFHALDRLTIISRERRKIQALDKPAVTKVEVRTVDAVDSEIEKLLALFAQADTTQRKQIAQSITEQAGKGEVVDAEVVEDDNQEA